MPDLRSEEKNSDTASQLRSLDTSLEDELQDISLDDEVQLQLDIIKVLLLRARERKFRFKSLEEQIKENYDGDEFFEMSEQDILKITVSDRSAFEDDELSKSLDLRTADNSKARMISKSGQRANRLFVPSRTELPENIVAFFSKIRHRRYEEVTAALEQDPTLSTEPRDEFGNTPLMLAAQAHTYAPFCL